MVFSLVGEIAADIWDDTIDAAKVGFQKNRFTKFITDVYGLGYRGGAFNGQKANEIIYKDTAERLEVYGYRKWRANLGEVPLTSYGDITWDGEEIGGFTIVGTLVKEPLHDLYDDNFSLFGAERVVAAGRMTDRGEETEMREEFVKNAIRYYSRKGKPIGNGFYVAEIPVHYDIHSLGDLIANWDAGLTMYYGLQTLSYYVTDWCATKFRGIVSHVLPGFLGRHFRERPKMSEQRLRRQYKRFTDNVNKWMGIDRDFVQMF